MTPIKQSFNYDLYFNTGGFFLNPWESLPLFLGDFFLIEGGKCRRLGNIREFNFYEPIFLSESIPLPSDDWKFHSGAHQCNTVTEEIIGEEDLVRKRCKQVFEFDEAGSFMFCGKDPELRTLLNWSELKDEMTLKMTQEHFGFREVYVATGVVRVSSWGLVVAEQGDAQLAVPSEVLEPSFFHWFFHETAHVERCHHILTEQQRGGDHPSFFKAKKLVINEKKKDAFTRELYKRYDKGKGDGDGKNDPFPLANWLRTDLLNMVVVNDLNLATCLEFFDWTDMTLDDLGKFGKR